MLKQRGAVCNVEDDTNDELLKQVGSTIYAVLDEFNSMQLGVKGKVLGEVDSMKRRKTRRTISG